MTTSNKEMAAHLKTLMENLEQIAHAHEELYDTDVLEQMSQAVLKSFIAPEAGYDLPERYGLFEEEGNVRVREAIESYVTAARQTAERISLASPAERLAAFQDQEVHTDKEEQYPDDFFGWMDPNWLSEGAV
jgi:hypothetical protein